MNRSPLRHRGPNLVGIRKVVLKQKDGTKNSRPQCKLSCQVFGGTNSLPGNEFTYPGWSHPTGYVKHRFTLPPAEDLTKVRLLNRHWVAHCWYRYCTVMVSWCQMMHFSERSWVIANLMPLILCSCSRCEVSLCLLVIALIVVSVETPGVPPVRSPQFQLRATDSASEGLFTLHEKTVWSQNQTWKAYNLCIVVSKGTLWRFFQAISFHVRWKADVISVGHAGTSMAPLWRTICFTDKARPPRRTLRTWQFMRAMYMIATWHVFHFSIYTRNCFKSRDWRYALPHLLDPGSDVPDSVKSKADDVGHSRLSSPLRTHRRIPFFVAKL